MDSSKVLPRNHMAEATNRTMAVPSRATHLKDMVARLRDMLAHHLNNMAEGTNRDIKDRHLKTKAEVG